MLYKTILAAALVSGMLVAAGPGNAQEGRTAPGEAKASAAFDAASLDAALKGMRAFNAKFADANAVSVRLTETEQKITAIRTENRAKVDDYSSTREGVSKCLRAFTSSRTADRTAQVQRKVMSIMTDQPALDKFSADYSRLALDLNAATARKDSAAMAKLNDEINVLLTLDAKSDSIAGARKCGVLPAKPPAVAQIDELQSSADGLTRELKIVEAAADTAGAKAAAVSPARFTQMRERLAQFVASDSAFTDKDAELLKAKKAEIEGLVKRS